MKFFQKWFLKKEKLPEKEKQEVPVAVEDPAAPLRQAYRNAKDEMERHFARNELIRYYYKLRDDQWCLVECERICIEDIAFIEERDRIVRERAEKHYRSIVELMGDSKSAREEYHSAVARGFNASLPSFERLVIMHMKRGNYEDALLYCNMAIEHYESHATTAEEYIKRRDRILKKKKQGD